MPVEAIMDAVQRPVCGRVPAKRAQRDRDTGQAEIQRTTVKVVDPCAQCIRTRFDGPAIPVIAEVLVCLMQREDHPGQTVVQGRIRRVRAGAVDQPVRRAAGQTRGPSATRQLIGPVHKPRLSRP
jgi:hypothetical protein